MPVALFGVFKRSKALDRARAFLKGLSAEYRVGVLYHSDADGLCSGVLTAKALELLRGRAPDVFFHQPHCDIAINSGSTGLLKKEKVNKLIIVDLCVDQKPEPIRKLEKDMEILVIDHHKQYNDLNTEKTVMVKASEVSDVEGSKYPASKLVFDLYSEFCDLSPYSWISSIGIIADMSLGQWKDFVFDSITKAGITLDTLLQLKSLIDSVEAVAQERMDELFKEFLQASKPEDLLSSKMMEFKKAFEEELNRLLDDFKQNAEFNEKADLVFYSFKSRYEVKSALINRVSMERYPHKTVVIVWESGNGMLRFSARRQDFRIKMNELLETATKGFKNSSAGGHIPAAAGVLMKSDLERFKQNVVKILTTKKPESVFSA